MVVNQGFKEFIELLDKHKEQYLVIFGVATAFHGNLRYAKDLDLWNWLHQENEDKLRKALDDFGIIFFGFKVERFFKILIK